MWPSLRTTRERSPRVWSSRVSRIKKHDFTEIVRIFRISQWRSLSPSDSMGHIFWGPESCDSGRGMEMGCLKIGVFLPDFFEGL